MKADNYFNKYGEIYGLEAPSEHCGYATKCIRFTNYENAQKWVHENTNSFRHLDTKSSTKHLGSNIRIQDEPF